MRRLLYSLSLIITMLPRAYAQQPVTLSLQDAMDYAVKNNVNAKNAELDLLIQKAKNAEITGLALPQVSAKGEFTSYLKPLQSFVPGEFIGQPGKFVAVPFTPKYISTASASASQVLFDGSVMVALQARNAIVKLSEQNVQLTKEEIRYNVQIAYYSFVVAKRQYNILNSSLAYIRDMRNELTALYKSGFAEKIEIDRTNVQLNNLLSDSIRVGNVISISEQLLKYQLGMNISQPIVLTDTAVNDKILEANQLLSSGLDYTNRTEFGLLQSQLTLNKYDLKRHQYSGLPSLAAFGTAAYNYASNNFSDIFKEQYIFYSLVGLQLNIPIFDGMQRRNRVKQAKFAITKTENNIENLKLSIDVQTESARTNLRNALLTLNNQDENLKLANTVLDLARRKYTEGVGSNLEVTEAQTQLLDAQNNYFSSLLQVINGQADLRKALGQFKN